MKTILKKTCPPRLACYAATVPYATWESMRNDAANGGDKAYTEAREYLIRDQKYLCAYCECKLREETPHAIRVEHFHPKSDTSSGHTWNLDWQNLLATCTGGEREGDAFPLPENLSCDACKKDEIHDGDIVNPLQLPSFLAAFWYDMGMTVKI
ncbi:MAG: TIGR02646 family protein [Desulfovibrionaceae bacterium]|nr:TIGR02646 family protein [Desulfovibrionaceae bacterium]